MKVNTRIVQYFLNKPKINIILLTTLIVVGIFAFSTLKTSGFPSADIKLVVISTIYRGASAKTIEEEITKPLEASIKDISGVETYTSTSSNNNSTINISISQKSNTDTVKSKIDSAVNSTVLPALSEKPKIIEPNISSGSSYYFALVSQNDKTGLKEMFYSYNILKTEIEKDSEVSKVTSPNNITKKVVVTVDLNKLSNDNLKLDDIKFALLTWGYNIPVADNITANNKTSNISLTYSGTDLTDISNLQITSISNPKIAPQKLSEISNVSFGYYSDGNIDQYSAYREGKSTFVSKSLLFNIGVSTDANLSNYDPKLTNIINKYFDTSSKESSSLSQETKSLFSNFKIIKVYSVADSNKSQVNDVVSGLIGSKIGDSPIGNLGYLLGGIELVFIAMLFVISWRAAIVSALAIPLSFFFSVIIVKLTGNDLNTLVLFSLVLVIGLVVDPALVVLESIQRSLDNGYKGKEAVIRAVSEIGGGLFMAVVTSILVFVPFGVVSGVFGQIISYIPLTILPALIGSYIVPLIFLAWLGGLILKRNKKSKDTEGTENLWPIARSLISLNERILNSHWAIRLLIIALAIIIPIGVAGYFVSKKEVKFVQFSQSDDTDRININLSLSPQQTNNQIVDEISQVENLIIKNPNVSYVSSLNTISRNHDSLNLVVGLVDKNIRTQKAKTIANDLTLGLNKYSETFFDINVSLEGVGVPSQNYPISLSINTNDLNVQKQVAEKFAGIFYTVCLDSKKKLVIDLNCNNSNKVITKVDNGYDGKLQTYIEVKLNRDKLKDNPINILDFTGILSNLYDHLDTRKISSFNDNGTDLDIVISNTNSVNPNSINEIKNQSLKTLTGKTINLSDIADVSEVQSPSSILRVKSQSIGVVSARPLQDFSDQTSVVAIQNLVLNEFKTKYLNNYTGVTVDSYSEGSSASISKSFSELGLAFLLAILLTYIALVLFFNSLLQPLVILFSIPLTFIGIFPALAYLGGGQLGFLEIIGIIILVGLVENVGIFLMDAANQKIKEGWDPKKAIAYASGVRFRPIFLTKLTTLMSTAPLAISSLYYKSLSIVIIFGLLTSGFLSLVVSPILYIFFKGLSRRIRERFSNNQEN